MAQDIELMKIKEAFEKVKLDINLIRESVLANYKEDQSRDRSIRALQKEIDTLKEELKRKTKKSTQKETKKQVPVPTRVSRKTIIAHTNTGKVHYEGCPYIKKSNKTDLKKYTSLKPALKDGFVRCTCIFNN